MDLVPTGLSQLSDTQTRISIATGVLQQLMANPLTMQMPEVQMIALETYMREMHYPARDRVMEAITRIVNVQQAQQAQMAAEQQAMQDQAMAEQQAAAGAEKQQGDAHLQGSVAQAEMAAQMAAASEGLPPVMTGGSAPPPAFPAMNGAGRAAA